VAISDGALIPGQPSGPAPGLAKRTRSAVAVVAALPCLGAASATAAEAMPVPFAPPTRRTARHGPLTSPDCAPRARPGYPYARLPQSTRTAGGSIIGQATARYLPGERAPEPPIMDVRQLAQYQADAPCRTAVTHAPGRCAAATICGVLRSCLGRRPPFVPPISTAAGQHAAGCPGASPAGL
jgi:hypothetical protein